MVVLGYGVIMKKVILFDGLISIVLYHILADTQWHPVKNIKYKFYMKKYFYMSVMMLLLASCGGRSQRLMNTIDGAVDDYNNGDSTSLIFLVIIALILGVLWLLKQKDK